MQKDKPSVQSIDDYIAMFPDNVQTILQTLRATIKAAAPKAQEKISYQMPTFALNGNLVYFAAFKNHIGFYPTGSGVEAFKDELSGYKPSKGTIQFPLDAPIPHDLITRIVQFRVDENMKKTASKKKKST